MRKPLLLLLLVFFGITAYAQNLSIFDLTNLTKMNNGDAHVFLGSARLFRQFYAETVNGNKLERYKFINKNGKQETVIIGDGVKTHSNIFLRTVTYTSTDAKYVASLVAQAAKAGLNKNFQGTDATKNIYLFDNFLYSVSIYINADNSSGTIVVKQKEYIGHEE